VTWQLLASTLALAASPAFAGAWRPALSVDGCRGRVSRSELRELLDVELQGVEPEVEAYLQIARPEISISCDAQVVISISARDGLSYREEVPVDQLGLTRFIAIAIIEGLTARARTESNVIAAPALAPAPPPVAAFERSLWLKALGGAGLNGRDVWATGTAELAVSAELHPHVSIEASVGATYGAPQIDVGHLDSTAVSLCATARWTTSDGPLRIELGVGARGGAVIWAGTASAEGFHGQRNAGPFFGPAVAVALGFVLHPRARLQVELEGDWLAVSSAALAAGEPVASYGPWRGAARLGLAVRL
jgi:hypothetical protein